MSDGARPTTTRPDRTGGPAAALPIGVPWYGAPLPVAVRRFWRGYVVLRGRASRSECWWWLLVAALVGLVFGIVAGIVFGATVATLPSGTTTSGVPDGPVIAIVVVVAVSAVWGLATLLPTIALGVRRLHDTGRSGWWLLLDLVPVVNLVLLVLLALPTAPRGDRYDLEAGPATA
ncbi:DUF805 domain-containing protein [Curtobacterium sp. MCBD17_034]|uniref:DUF805 domain-containing protein n=1 Tax=unclassified Curtobacterium TaxID=257496 RepID=UPI000DA83B1B|nr:MULTISPECIES: DUF805 domain-containing protein [unclassified Curtobacterium]PZF62357.1 DUF805 domain-containing protein [Curtobacterium sp. MCBD17_034]PZM39936.1 DUF805 domain-containing protein [Curtobacterium sp. MCBD17_031]